MAGAAQKGDMNSGDEATSDRADPLRNDRPPRLPQDEAGAPMGEGTCPGFVRLTENADLLGCTLVPPSPIPTRRGDSEGETKDQGH